MYMTVLANCEYRQLDQVFHFLARTVQCNEDFANQNCRYLVLVQHKPLHL